MSRNHRFERAFLDQFEDRLRISIAIIALLFAVLFFVFWRVQVFNGGLYSDLARNNRIRKIIIPAPRGSLLDRKGVILADNRPSFDVEIVIEDIPRGRKKEIAGRLASVLNITEDVILEKIQSSRRVPYVPEKIARDISLETVTVIQEMREHFPGITITPVPVRDYRFGTFASHVIGYLGKLSPDEYKNLKDSGYYIQDYIGKMGIEKAAERYLKGEHGGMQVQVDYRGYTDKVLGIKNPVQGNNVYLTIDHHIQEKAETLMAEKSGAIIVMDTRNGDVLALVSAPEFDPNLFIKPTDPAIIQDIFQSEKKYLLNKATRELYPPGSTFKLLIAMAAMENAGLSMVKKYDCRGAFKLGGFTFHCWYRKGHGTLNVSEAIRYSCNVFFYNLADDLLGIHDINEWANNFGFGERTGIDLDSESAGINPSIEWKKNTFKESWYPGDTINMSIGQGYMLATPLQVACYITALANGGKLFKPRLLNRVVSSAGKDLETFPPVLRRQINFTDEHHGVIVQAMKEVVQHPYGTGINARVDGVEVSGKTGTVQVGTPANRRHHAWFVGFAPSDSPEVSIVVLVENASAGSTDAAPLAAEILKTYFMERMPPLMTKDISEND